MSNGLASRPFGDGRGAGWERYSYKVATGPEMVRGDFILSQKKLTF